MPDRDKRRLLHLISQWFAEEKFSHQQIADKIREWVKNTAPDCYNPKGHVSTQFVGRRIAEAAQEYRFLRVSPYYEEELSQKITRAFLLERSEILVAPDRDELLRYVWLDLSRLLTDKVKTHDATESVVVGVSGGQTMLDLAKVARSLPEITWHEEVPTSMRKKVIICSLTSGGIRSNIAALSDTVAASIAEYLGGEARGLLGPAWFADSLALTAFRNDPGVQEHIQLVKEAEVILTSVGYLGDRKALMRQMLDHAGESRFVEDQPNLADILYNCYDGLSGEPIELPETIRDHMFSVINLEQLRRMVRRGSRCIVLAVGKQKGYHAVPGILRKQMASHIYMDKACAEGVLETLQ